MRKIKFANGEYYHVFNRGVDKRTIFQDMRDLDRFFKSMKEFNRVEPIGSIYEYSFELKKHDSKSKKSKDKPLVEFVAYCLNPNHYHFLLLQVADKGIEKFMHRLGLGYTKYFNERHKRTGSLFQGVFKAVYVDSNEQLLHLSAYINLNKEVHTKFGNSVSKSSWEEFIGSSVEKFCSTSIILGQFKKKKEYQEFAQSSLKGIKERRYESEESIYLET